MFLEKNSIAAAKFVDSLLKILKTEQENDKIIFPSYQVCSVVHTSLPEHKQQLLLSSIAFKRAAECTIYYLAP